MTNKEYLQSCSTEELALLLTKMSVGIIERLTGATMSQDYVLEEFDLYMEYLEKEVLGKPKNNYIH